MILAAVCFISAFDSLTRYYASKKTAEAQQAEIGSAHQNDPNNVVTRPRDFDPFEEGYAQWLMAGFSVLATIVSFWAVRKVDQTLRATQKGNRINRRVGEAQVRAYPAIVTAQIAFHQAGLFGPYIPRVTLQIANYGNSPALRFRWGVKIAYAYEGSAADTRGTGITTPKKHGVDIRPQGQPERLWFNFPEAALTPEDIAAWRLRKLRVYVDVDIAFRDVFGKSIRQREFFRADIPARKAKAGASNLILAKGIADIPNYLAGLAETRSEREALREGLKRFAEENKAAFDEDEDDKPD